MARPEISVIIPTYNSISSLGRAIDSALSQPCSLEVIVVDDASTDGTEDFLKNYSDPRVIVARNATNMKLGASRNEGMKLAKGTYITFLDSDDWLSPEALPHMLDLVKSNDVDVVASGVQKVSAKGVTRPYYAYDFTCSGGEEALELFSIYKITSPACSKLYRLEFLHEHGLRFIVPYWHEDILFSAYVALKCKKYTSIKNFYYNYYENTNSVTQGPTTRLHLDSYFNIYKEFLIFQNVMMSSGISSPELIKRIWRNYGSAEMFPKLIKYASSRSKETFQKDLFSSAVTIMGNAGYPIADIVYAYFSHHAQ